MYRALIATVFAASMFVSTVAVADEAAVRAAVSAYVEAFNKQDLKAIAAAWAPKATHTNRETGERTEGRDAIAADVAGAFKSRPSVKLSGRVDKVRFIRPEVAQIEGQSTIAASNEEPEVSAFTAILVNDNGKWLFDSIDEMPLPQPPTPADALAELAWLVGRWTDSGEDAHVETTIRWSTDNAFLLRSFTARDADGDARSGTQVIGWDPRAKEIRSWTFNSDGSFGDGTWTKSGDSWLIKSSQTLDDGRAASGTYVLTRVDENSITLQLMGHEIEGEPQPTSPTVKVARVVEAKQPAPLRPASR